MEYLIVTQILIWFQLSDSKLSKDLLDILIDTKNTIFVSDISFYEIGIKQKVGKISEFDKSISEIVKIVIDDDFQILPIKINHIDKYNQIPLIPDHKDPFDRLLLSTALFENFPIITSDEKFRNYSGLVSVIFN